MSSAQRHAETARSGPSGTGRVRFSKLNTLNLDLDPDVVTDVSFDGLAEILCGTRAYWESRPKFVPPENQVVVWTDRSTVDGKSVPGFKVGDGHAYNIDLPFVGDDVASGLAAELSRHTGDQLVHVSAADRSSWNGKVDLIDEVVNEALVFRR